MEIRIFQIIVPVVALLFIIGLITRYRKAKATTGETLFSVTFWLAVGVFALFPDKISNFLARLFGIKDNVNAIIFVGLGLLFYAQFALYNLIKEQQRSLTKLTRELALKEAGEEEG